ncbi:MAG: hypothetical protein H6737_02410 [Alphaproteobacteria bacterium]|nr:hypothetical protein [Alphaproteobacteria bacterium]
MRVLPIVLLVGCPAPEPVDTDPPTPVPLVQAEPRTLTFTLVPDLGNGTVLDLDLDVDGRSAAVIQKSLGDGEVWVDTGAGWTLIFELDARLPTCVALEPGGDRLLVGANAGIAYILRDDGSIVRDAMQVGLAAHPLRQCAWTDDTLAVSQSSENGVEGGVWAANYTNPEFLTWVEQVPEFRTYQDLPLWDGIYGADGLSLGSGGLLTVGVSFSLPGSPTETVVSGTANADVWSTNPASDSVAPGWGRPRDFGDFPGNGGGQLFRRPGQSTVWTTGPVGTFGLAELTPAGATGVLYAMDVAADGHLWLGGDQGLYRSDEVLRSGP